MKKFFIIAFIVVVIVIVVLMVILATKKGQLLEFAIDKSFPAMEKLMVANRPASVSEDSIQAAIDEAIEKIRFGEPDHKAIGEMMMKFRRFMEDERLDSLEVRSMLEEMKKL